MVRKNYMLYCDCDGTLNKLPKKVPKLVRRILKRLPEPLYGFFTFLLRGEPRKEVIETLRKIKEEGSKIIIITARLKFSEGRLKSWLRDNRIPFTELICTGPFRRIRKKLKIIEKKGIRTGMDNEIVIGKKGDIEIISPDNHRKLLERIQTQMVV